MFTLDMQLLTTVLDEVVDLVDSPVFLSGENLSNFQNYQFGGYEAFWCVRNISEYIYSLDGDNTEWPPVKNEGVPKEKYPEYYLEHFEEQEQEEYESPFFKLNEDALTDIQETFKFINDFSSSEISLEIQMRNQELEKLINESSQILSLAQEVYDLDKACNDPSLHLKQIKSCIAFHFDTIMKCRALTLSKRYVVTEILFNAYHEGFYPYGWDWGCDTVFCIRPSQATAEFSSQS